MIRRPPRSTLDRSSAASDVYKRQLKYKPDLILGDLDSIDKETEKSMKELGIEFLCKPEEDHTDSEKSLIFLEEEVIPKITDKNVNVIILGAFGGRMDHTLYNIHLLWKKIKDGPTKYQLFMVNNENLMTGIAKGHTIIKVPKKLTVSNGCGVVPIGKCEYISTKGLKYDMGPDCMVKSLEFGEFISTSNEIVEDVIDIEVSDPVIWVTQIDC
eukprot:TRINITY_DN1163_c0_g5_i11.p1 TRINITY_DN1163_c0_g5~~TRINITY_DN1163_c0_g5_i11.p1  ORF type:complete len:223 (+),score=54.08 TRINITY_DN1163_c0_g5_i11:31-669(+)